MNYKLIEKDGVKVWAKIILNQKTDKIEFEPVEGPITLNPNEYYDEDVVAITSNPPHDPKNCIPIEDYIKELEEKWKNEPRKEFKPYVYYCTSAPGQAVEAILTSEAHYAKWINPYLTVFYSVEENKDKIVGFRVDGLISLKVRHEQQEF